MTRSSAVINHRIIDFYGKLAFIQEHERPQLAMILLFNSPFYWEYYNLYSPGSHQKELLCRILNLKEII